MSTFRAAFWAEALKARRALISRGISLAFAVLPLVSGLFMIILKDPVQARSLGLISVKAQLVAGEASWPALFDILLQGTAIGGSIVFAFITAWVFGREFSDRTAKELLATPTPRWIIVSAKMVLIALWIAGLVLCNFVIGLGLGAIIGLPGWSPTLAMATLAHLLKATLLLLMLMPCVALFASAGRGYLPALGWALGTLVLAQIVGVLGWGDWFPWAVPMLISGMAGPGTELVGAHSYVVVLITLMVGAASLLAWWQSADQTR